MHVIIDPEADSPEAREVIATYCARIAKNKVPIIYDASIRARSLCFEWTFKISLGLFPFQEYKESFTI